MLISNNKKNLVLNSKIELNETDGKGKGHYFISRFIEAGLAHYENLGDILITKETLDKFVQSMVGCPVIINHKDIDDKNVEKERVGVISRVWYNEADGWYYCEGVITDEQAVDLVKNQGWNVSCSYNFVSTKPKDKYHGKDYDMEFIDGEFLHLAIVETPRYEGANIVVNSADDKWSIEKSDEEGFITLKYGEKSWKVPVSELKESNKGFESYINKIISNITKEKFDIEKFDKSGYKYKIRMQEEQFNSKIMDKVKEAFINTNKLSKAPYYEEYAGDKCMILEFEDKKVNNNDDITWITVKDDDTLMDLEENFYDGADLKENGEWNKMTHLGKKKDLEKNKANNNIGDITMTVLNDLKDFIMNVVNNEKEDDMEKDVKNEKVDKRDIIRQIMAIAGKNEDNEDVRTIAKLAEKLAYNPSEDSKADNSEKEEKEEKFEEEKEIANKEEDKEDDKVTENEEDKKEAKNKCKNEDKEDEKVENSIQTTKEILFGGIAKEQKDYLTREERIELGNEY